MVAMDSRTRRPSPAARPRSRFRAGLTVAGSAVLMAACSILEPVAEKEASPAESVTSPAAGGRERPPRTLAGEPTRLPDQTGLEPVSPVPGAGAARSRGATGQTRARPRAQAGATSAPAAGTSAAGTPATTAVARGVEPPAPWPVSPTSAVPGGSADDTTTVAGIAAAAAAAAADSAGDAGADGKAGIEADIEAALARTEPLHPTANRPYRIANRRYQPMTTRKPFRQRGMSSWYGKPFHGRKTAIGERFNMTEMTAAHPTLPLPSWVRVTNARTGTSVVVRVNDRGPFAGDRIIDLSRAAASRLGFIDEGLVAVEVELLLPGDNAQTESAD